MVRVHRAATYVLTVMVVAHVLVAAGVLPGYRGVWRALGARAAGMEAVLVMRPVLRDDQATAPETPPDEPRSESTPTREPTPTATATAPRSASERYYLYRVLRQLELSELLRQAILQERAEAEGRTALSDRLIRDEQTRRVEEFRRLIAEHPERVIELAVKGMMPKNALGRAMKKKLKVYPGGEHPHEGQQPQPLRF
jgi:hypothetical protein